MPYTDYCETNYNTIYQEKYILSLNGRTGETAQKNAEREAQKIAIKDTLKSAIIEYPDVSVANIWRAIYVAHLKRKSGFSNFDEITEDIIAKVISADQSWKKASGHAFEAFIYEVANPLLAQYNIKFMLQTDIHQMLKEGNINNDAEDVEWLNQRIHTDVFDLYAVVSFQGQNYVFGCIQSKTSIRDRVTRDREPSRQAMDARFWSIAVALDGAFLALPKFKEMVNGGGNDYPENGWHAMYVMGEEYEENRIFYVDRELTQLVEHARQASISWIRARHRFGADWYPDN